jgi:hypothetical protein
MGLKYAERPSESVLFRDNFISDDYVEDNGGTIVNDCIIDNGLTTDGTHDYIDYGDVNNLGAGSWSFNFKVSIPSAGVQTYLVSKHEDADNRWYIRIDATGRIFMYSVVATAIVISAVSGISITEANTEYSVQVVGDRDDTLRFYVDGAESVGTVTTFTAVNLDNTGEFNVGRWSTSLGEFTMKDLDIYNVPHTAEEALDIYQRDAFTEIDASKAVVWLPCRSTFDDGSNVVTKNLGTADNCIVGDGAGSNNPTLLSPHGFEFNGTDDYLDLGTDNLVTDDCSISCMVKSDNQVSAWMFQGVNTGEYLTVFLTSSGVQAQTASGAGNSSLATLTWGDGKWHHIAIVRNGDTHTDIQIFLDGVEQSIATNGNVAIGNSNYVGGNGADAIDGIIDKFIMYPFAITPVQVRELKNNALNNLNI